MSEEVHDVSYPKSRTEHKCKQCDELIPKYTTYVSESFRVMSGHVPYYFSKKYHQECYSLYNKYNKDNEEGTRRRDIRDIFSAKEFDLHKALIKHRYEDRVKLDQKEDELEIEPGDCPFIF